MTAIKNVGVVRLANLSQIFHLQNDGTIIKCSALVLLHNQLAIYAFRLKRDGNKELGRDRGMMFLVGPTVVFEALLRLAPAMGTTNSRLACQACRLFHCQSRRSDGEPRLCPQRQLANILCFIVSASVSVIWQCLGTIYIKHIKVE